MLSSNNLLTKTNIIVPCLMQHTNFNYIWVREQIKLDYKGGQTFKYSVLFCLDGNYCIAPMFKLPDGVPCPADSNDYVSGEGLYQNLNQSSYFVKLTDRCVNGRWGEPILNYYLPDVQGLKPSTHSVPSTGYDKFEFGLGEVKRLSAGNKIPVNMLDAAAPKFTVLYRQRAVEIIKRKIANG